MPEFRTVGQGKFLPYGAGVGNDSGLSGDSAFLDHIHKLFDAWVSVPLGGTWYELNPLRVCRAGNLCLLEGELGNSVTPGNIIGTLPEGFRAAKGQIFGCIYLGGGNYIDGEIILDAVTNPGELSLWRNNVAIDLTTDLHLNGIIYRLD